MRMGQTHRGAALLHGCQAGPLILGSNQVTRVTGEGRVDCSQSLAKGPRFLIDVADQHLDHWDARKLQPRLPKNNGSLWTIPDRRRVAVNDRASQAPQPTEQGRLRLSMHIVQVVRPPPIGLDEPRIAHQDAGNLAVVDGLSSIPMEMGAGMPVIKAPAESLGMR